MANPTEKFTSELTSELNNILEYWKKYSVDEENGGFVGQRDHDNKEISGASKGIILNTRILWTFSAAGNFRGDDDLKFYADRAYNYLKDNFRDKDHQGVFWEVDSEGKPLNKRKQIYAQAFAIYALSEYYIFSGDGNAKEWALELFRVVEEHARDQEYKGYFEAFHEDWTPIEDMRLSEKDKNSAKTMNTHLHVLEAYTTLYKISEDKQIEEALESLSFLFLDKFYDGENQHFQLFFDKEWNREGNTISYGHDIEAVWLLMETAKELGNVALINKTRELTVDVADTFLYQAWEPGAGIINEKDLDTGETDTDRHWWPQAEAMVGLDYAYSISGKEKFQEALLDIWEYTKENIIDRENGEWFFRVDKNNNPYKNEDKLGMWKCPYHNSRACMELLKRKL